MNLYQPTISGSLVISGSIIVSGSVNATQGVTASFSGQATSASFASSVGNLNQSVQITGSLGVTSTITAQTLNVQTVSSSVVYSSGSNIFGNSSSNVQQFTGSVSTSGSLYVTSGSVGIGTSSPSYTLDVTGTGRFTGALSSGGEILTSGGQLALSGSGGVPSTGVGIRYNGTFYVYAGANGFNVRNSANSANNLTIADSGAATFSSIVGIGMTPIAANGALQLSTNTGVAPQIYYTNGTTATYFGVDAFASNVFGGGTTGAYPFIFVTNSTEKMRITSGGNVGIGTSSPAYPFDVKVATNAHWAISQSGTGYASFRAGNDGYAAFVRGEIDASTLILNSQSTGNVLIGTTTDRSFKLVVEGTDNNNLMGSYNTTSGASLRLQSNQTVNYIVSATNNLQYQVGSGIVATMTTAGDFQIGTTPTANGHNFFMASGNGAYQTIGHPNGTSTGYSYTIYYYNSGAIGGVSQSGTTAVVYNTTSDYRLKEVISPIQNSIDKILKLKPIHFKWKNTEDEYGDGFLAHELQEIIPLAVTGEKDALNEDGTYKLQQVDHSKLVPVLVKAIQELSAKVTTLEDIIQRNNLS